MSDVKITREYVSFDEAVPKPNKNLVEVVRCKDCKQGVESYKGDAMLCNKNGRYHGLDWFCADGQRKESV